MLGAASEGPHASAIPPPKSASAPLRDSRATFVLSNLLPPRSVVRRRNFRHSILRDLVLKISHTDGRIAKLQFRLYFVPFMSPEHSAPPPRFAVHACGGEGRTLAERRSEPRDGADFPRCAKKRFRSSSVARAGAARAVEWDGSRTYVVGEQQCHFSTELRSDGFFSRPSRAPRSAAPPPRSPGPRSRSRRSKPRRRARPRRRSSTPPPRRCATRSRGRAARRSFAPPTRRGPTRRSGSERTAAAGPRR